MAVLLAVLGATAAAWWPGRTVARLPVMLALSGRPPRPRPARHSAIAAAALIAVGIGCLALSDRDQPAAHRRRDRGDDPRQPAPRPAGDPHLLRRWPDASRSRRAWRCETSPATRPVPERRSPRSPSPSASQRRSSSPRRPRRSGRRADGRRAAQPVRPPDPRLHRPDARPGAHPAPDPDARPARRAWPRASASSPPVSIGRP